MDVKDDRKTINEFSIATAISVTEAIDGYTSGDNSFSCFDDPDDAIIDESSMPMELRGKKWKTERSLGEGGNYEVYLLSNDDGLKYAMRWNRKQDRSITENKKNEQRKNEQRLFKSVLRMEKHIKNALQLKEVIGHHPNIVSLIGFRKVNLFTQQIMEYIDGGDLHDFIKINYTKKDREMEIRKVRSLFSDLLKAVKHIHRLCIAHMDIKAENCLITLNGNLKLTDFDNAVHFGAGKKIFGLSYATKEYAAPETFSKEYRPDCADMWACGIVLHFLLKQGIPWEAAKRSDQNYREWYKAKCKKYFFCFPPLYEDVSEFLLKMLEMDADKRATVDEIITHRWLQYPGKTSEN
ncbi:Protein kinase domain family protein [Acanthocheilonema viteae]|uniref:Protein kinase domain-containing protein n=1 Tax=Acanthocheilonema viteae TaxID=6277 RepID=A0A498SRF3_ACAVI|nr:unnamed protein product [Acanthocheilonema viteae]